MKDSDWEILAELYKNPNLTKVAGILSMTQPSISKRLKVMEKEYGTEIVSRTGPGLSLRGKESICEESADVSGVSKGNEGRDWTNAGREAGASGRISIHLQ